MKNIIPAKNTETIANNIRRSLIIGLNKLVIVFIRIKLFGADEQD